MRARRTKSEPPCRRRTHRRRSARGLFTLVACLLALAGSNLVLEPAHAGTLDFFEGGTGPGATRLLGAPANEVMLDIDYGPSSAEGGGLYGFSEVLIVATGDLVLTPTGFACTASGCLYSPLPFEGGRDLHVTAGDDLGGEFSGSADLLTVAVSGTLGYVAVVRGEYIDASGPGMNLGSIQQVGVRILAAVPEPSTALALALGCAFLAFTEASRQRRSRSS